MLCFALACGNAADDRTPSIKYRPLENGFFFEMLECRLSVVSVSSRRHAGYAVVAVSSTGLVVAVSSGVAVVAVASVADHCAVSGADHFGYRLDG
jgi:hypothetical protein